LNVRRDELVAAAQAEPGENDVAGVGGRADEGHVHWSNIEHPGQGFAGAFAQGEDLLEVRLSASAMLEVASVPFGHRLDRCPGERAVRPGVQVREPFENGELGSRFLESHFTLASTGA